MGFYPKKLNVAGVAVSASAVELNLNDSSSQALTDAGAITIKNGVVTLSKAGVIAATLADPTATTDDFKRLTIVALTAQADTVTIAGGASGGAAASDVWTYGGAIGNSISLIAFNGKWHVVGIHGVTVG